MAVTEERAVPVARERTWASTYVTLPRTVLLLSVAMLFMRAGENFYVPILPLYVKLLDAAIPLFVVGLVVGIHRLGLAASAPFIGSWCDRIGYRKPFIIGVVIAAAASAAGGLAFGIGDLTVYRLLAGLGYGTMNIAALAYINAVTRPENRGTAMSLLAAAILAGAAIGPFPGGYIAESLSSQLSGYRWTFYGGGMLQLAVGVFAYFLIRGRGEPSAKPAAASRGLALFGQAVKHKGVAITALGVFLFGLSFSGFLYFLVPLLGSSLGLGAIRIGWIISGFAVGLVLGSLFVGPISDRMGRRKPFVFFSLLGPGLAILLFSQVGQVPLMVLSTFLLGLFTSPSCGIGPAMVAELLPQAPASAMALLRTGEMLGMFSGPMVAGVLLSVWDFSAAMYAFAAITMAGSLVFLAAVREPETPRPVA